MMRRFSKIAFFNWISRVAWLALATGTCVLLVSAIRAKNNQKCKSLTITIDHGSQPACVQTADLMNLLRERHLDPQGKNLRSVDAWAIDSLVESDPWISEARVYLDNGNQLHIRATQRIALARVFSISGESFFLDSEGHRMPLPPGARPLLPVFTSFPSGQNLVSDSGLLAGLIQLGKFLIRDSFWNAQTDQVNILDDKSFELIPRIGDQVILLGDGSDLAVKFRKLMAFYRQVLNVGGWEKYDTINLSYKNEIVAVRRPARKGLAAAVHPAPVPVAAIAGKPFRTKAGTREQDFPAGKMNAKAAQEPKAIYTGPQTHQPSINTTKNN